MKIVIDNSVVMRWFFGDGSPQGKEYSLMVLDEIPNHQCIVPCVWFLEVANVLVRAETKNMTTEAKSQAFLQLLQRLNFFTDTNHHQEVNANILHLSRRHGLSSYDASYLELALRENASLATLDDDLLRAAKKAGVPIL